MATTLNTKKITRYTYAAPSLVPIDEAALEDGEVLDTETGETLDWAALVTAAGFDSHDNEVYVTVLTEDWKGHQGGDLVVTGLTVEGHPFAVVPFDCE